MHDPTQDGELEETEKINVVPLADLTLVLLIVLMVLSPMITQSMIRVQTPVVENREAAAPAPLDEPEPLLVEISAQGYRLNNEPFTEGSALIVAIAERIHADGRRPVIVSPEDGVTVGRIVEVLDGAKNAKAKTVALVKNLSGETMMPDVRRRVTSDGAISGVNIVPVIDLCLVLLVVLMIISPLIDAPPVKVDLPEALFEDRSERSTINVSIDPAGAIAVNDKRVENLDTLGQYMKRVAGREQMVQPLVILRTDKDVAYGSLTEIIAVLKAAGFEDIALGTRPIEKAVRP